MKKKAWIYSMVIIALVLVIVWLRSGDLNSTTSDRRQDYDFTIPDTNLIDKVIIREKLPREVQLERTEKGWILNGKYLARKSAVDIMLETFNRMKMRNFVSQTEQPVIIKRLAASGKEVEVYKKGKLYKTFYIENQTPDEMGTYMMIKQSDAPYVVHIPGFNGFLTTRFFTEENLWRDRAALQYANLEIARVELVYNDSINASFRIEVPEQRNYQLYSIDEKKNVPFNTTRLEQYLAAFRNVHFEGLITPAEQAWARKDSILSSLPAIELTVAGKKGKQTHILIFKKEFDRNQINTYEQEYTYDPDRYYALIDGTEFVLIQNYAFSNVLKSLAYFRS